MLPAVPSTIVPPGLIKPALDPTRAQDPHPRVSRLAPLGGRGEEGGRGGGGGEEKGRRTLLLSILHNPKRSPILNRPTRVLELGLAEDVAPRSVGELIEPNLVWW